MAKIAQQNKISKDSRGISIEHQNIEDDSLLPPAEELVRLNKVSPEIITWIMKCTEKEQDARIKFNEDRMRVTESDFKHVHQYNFTALILAFLIVVLFLGSSFYLIINGFETIGSIFAGSTLALIVFYFLRVPKFHSDDNNKKTE
jgi:uncharacterized membrane protein